jgi:hypothetical protein
MGIPFATIDVEADAELEFRYGRLIPVLLIEDEELARAPLDEVTVRKALARAGYQ